uniref:Protein tesmin/TSO1-like CXC 2 n=1 Tax=Angiostrongylus cantonensis TaxID=6313 RepID=A0A0K0D212_ANGCA
MDVPILGSAPLKFSVEASARRAKSFGGFLTHGRSYSKSVGSFGRPYSRAGNRLRHKALQKSPSTDVPHFEDIAVNHNQDVMNTNLTTSVISSNTSLPKEESEDRAVLLYMEGLCSLSIFLFKDALLLVDTVFQRAADCYQNGQYDVHQAKKHALQLKSNRSRTENLSNLDNKLLSKNITTATDVSIFQDSQEGLVETPAVDGYANASLSFESPRSPAKNTAPCVESSPQTPLSSSTSPEEECFEGLGNFDGANIADQSFMSFSRAIVSGLQSINATPLSSLGDDVVCNQLNQQRWNSYSSSAKCELFPLNEDNSHEGINSKGVCDLESENCIFGFVEINEENVCSSEVGRHNYVAGRDVVEDIDENQLLPHSSVKLEAHKLRETLSSSHLCSCEVVSLQNADLENGVFNEADGDLIKKSGASKRSLRRKRARPMSNESVRATLIS